ncbi:MAG: FecR domain-containing protein [Alphaproteobacteria bacterium]|nr:FecR domain-containing protein [Alphaproteobacteria bacterium]
MNILEALKAQSEAAGETYVELNADGPTVVPGGDDLLLSEYSRLGPDLQITLPSGDSVVVVDYFSGGGVPPSLQTEGGAVINGDLVAQLAGPMVPDTQIAQSGTSDALGEAAGVVDNMKGEVIAIRGGVEVELGAGDSIYEGDVLVTGADSAVGIIFTDDSTMSMGGGARISIDEMVYNADSGSGSQLFDVVQGAFVFASGQIGKDDPENVQVRTPVATIGIRGTKYAVNVDQELGEATVTLFEGAVVVENGAGQALLNSIGQSTVVTSAFAAPGDVFVMDPDTQTSTYGDAIDYHPNEPQLREDDDGGGEDGQDTGDLGADELEKLAEELDDLDTAAGPSGAIAGFTQSALFLRLLNGVLEGGEFTSGELGNDGFEVGSDLPIFDESNANTDSGLGNQITGPLPSLTYGADAFGPLGGTVTFSYGSATNVSVQGGSSAHDIFAIDISAGTSGTTWSVSQSGGNVIISESGGAGTKITMDDVEELQFDLGGAGDHVTIGDISNTDIADSTVMLNAGAGDDVIDGSGAGKRFEIDGGTGNDTLIGDVMNDDISGGEGNDTLDGGEGKDLLIGGAGDDTLKVTLEGGTVEANPPTIEDAIINFKDSAAALARTYDVVAGGDGEDTVVLTIPASQLTNTEYANELIELKALMDGLQEGQEATGEHTFPALGLQISGVENVVFQGAGAEITINPSLEVGSGQEDGSAPVSLALDGAIDSPLLELTVVISGVPEGATLTVGGKLYSGGADITLDLAEEELSIAQLEDMVLNFAPDSAEPVALSATVTANAVLTDDGPVTSAPLTGTATVEAIADVAEVTVEGAAGLEDGLIPLSISVTQGDADGSETVTVAIQDLPEGAKLFDADGNEVDPASIPVEALDGLSLQPPLNFSGAITLKVIATSTEGNTSAVSETQDLTVQVSGIADGATVDVSPATGLEDGVIALDISATLADSDEILTLSIGGLPEGAKLVDGAGNEIDPANIGADQIGDIHLVPPLDFSGEIDLSVTATTQDGESTKVSDPVALTVSVDGVADAPIVQVGDVTGDEDGLINLSISVAQGDADGSETVTVAIQNLPEGAKLFDAGGNEVDPSNIPADSLAGLKLLPPLNFAGALSLGVVATSAEGGTTATSEATSFTVDVSAVADAAELEVSPAAGLEDGAIALDISAAATDEGETLTLSISGLPEGAKLVDGAGIEIDPANIGADQIGGIHLVPPLDYSGTIDLTVTATTQDGESQAVTTGSLSVSVSGVADAPVVQVGNGAGDEDTAISLSISVAQGDADGSETVSVAIEGLPVGAILMDAEGNLLDPGDIPVGSLQGLTLTPPLNFNGALNLTVVATSAEGETTATTSQSFTVDVAAVADGAELELEDVADIEGNAVSLNIGAVLSDTEESLTIAITGLPEGASIIDAAGTVLDPTAISGDALDGLKMVLPDGFSGEIALGITATTADGDSTAVSSGSLNVSISGVASEPELIVSGSVGSEDNAIGLSIQAFSTDPDGSEDLTVAIAGLPEGARLLDAQGNDVDPADVPPALLSGLQIVPPVNFSGTIDLTVTATSSEDGTSAVKTGSLSVEVTGVADTPELDLSDVAGDEGVPLALNISAALTDTDGSETLTVEIGGLPQGFVLSDGTNTYSGDPVSIPPAALSALTLLPVAGFAGALSLTVTATATEANGDTSSVTETLGINLSDVAETPVLSVLNAVGDEDATIPLSISASAQGDDSLTVTISGLPDGASLTNAAGETFTGDEITLTAGQLAGLKIQPSPNSDADFSLTVTATATDGEDSAEISSSLTVTVDGVADTPSLSVSSLTGVEDVPIALNIQAALTDIDGSESLTVEIDGLGEGFSLKAADGTIYSGDPAEIPADALSGLVLLSPQNFSGDLSLTIRAIATEGENGDTALVERNMSISIAPELDLPTITAVTASGNEDESIPLDISIGNIDPNETVTVSIENLPDGATLTNSAGQSFTGGTVTLTVDQLEGLAVIPPQDSGADFDLTIRVTTAQGDESASTSQELGVTVLAKADDPTLIVGDTQVVLGRAEATTEIGTSGDDTLIGGAGGDTLIGGDGNDHLIGDGGNLSAVVSLNLEAYSNDIDGSEVVTVTIEGLPDGVQLLQGGEVLVTGGGATLPADMLDSITLLVPPGTADFNLQITARTTDFDPDGGGDSATHTASIAVSVEDGSGLGSNDVLIGGDGNDLLEGGDGADTLMGGTGDDTLLGGAGNDILYVVQGEGEDVVDGGSGSDTLTLTVTEWDLQDVGIVTDLQELVAFVASGSAATGSMVFESLGLEVKNIEGLNIVDTNGDPVDVFDIVFPDPGAGITYTGDNDDNVATGTDKDDTMSGGHGDDTLYGEGGDDTLYGDNGDDVLYGGSGDDTLYGGHGDDTLVGGTGNDTLYGGNGDDTIDGGAGDDTVEAGHGDDVIRMGTGSGSVDAGTGDDLTVVTIDAEETDRDLSLDGGHGDDTLRIELSADHPNLQAVIAEIAAATAAAQSNSSGTHSIDSLGISFKNFEDIEVYVDGAQYTYAPEIDEVSDLSVESAAVSAGAQILGGISLSDVDGSQLTQATIHISGGYQAGDKLTVDQGVLSELGLSVESATATGDGYLLTISGDGSLSDYETALEAVRLGSDDSVPEAGDRTVSVQVTDDDGNTSDAATVVVGVSLADAPNLADTGEGDNVAFISEASESGATVTDVADVPAETTETLSVVVGKNSYTGTGQFEVMVNGVSMGTFTTTVKASGFGGEWQTVEIGDVTLPLGQEVDIAVRAVSSSSDVLLKSITYGDAAIEAETGDITSISSIIEEVTTGLDNGQSWGNILTNLADDWVNLFSSSYIMLDPNGDASNFTMTPGEDLNPLDGWTVAEDDVTRDLQDDDLGDRFDEIDLGGGTDWAVAAAGTEDDLTVDLSGSVWRGTENALGGRGDDTLIGNEDANLLAGGDGDDVLIADGDNDLLIGGAGDDEMHYDIADLQAAGNAAEGGGFGTVDQAISDAYDANDLDGAAALESLRAGVDGGSGMDTLKLTGGNGGLSSLSGDALANAIKNVEILDVTGVDGPVDMSLSVDDLIEMTDDRDELKILKDGEDTVKVGDQEYGAGEHTVSIDGVDFKLTIEDVDSNPDV